MSYEAWREWFAEATDPNLYPPTFLDWLLSSGRARFWENENAAIIAEMRSYPSGALEVHGTVAAGDIEAIKKLIPLAEEWGRSLGATRASIASHPAWARIMKDAGYRVEQLTIAKDL